MDATSHPDAGPRLPETSAPGGDAALHEEALAVLRRLVDRPDARFKDGQFEAIEALVAHRRRAHDNGEWVREAALAHAEKQARRTEAAA